MKVNPNIFRGYDLRGLVDIDLNPGIAEHLGRAHGTFLKRRGITEALVGYDCRATSPEYATAFIRGLCATGTNVTNIGMTMVGTYYWVQHFLKIRGGAFVTASHNPAEYNGFKFSSDLSETLVAEGMVELRRLVEEEDYDLSETLGTVIARDILPDYIADLQSRFNIEKKLKVVIDPSAATPGLIVPRVLEALGFEVVCHNCEIDPTFPLGTPDPTEERVAQRLSAEVVASGADIGFSYDADGDRIGIVDETGRIIWNDVLLALFSLDVLHYHPGATIMFNTLCSRVVPETIARSGGVPFMWRTGHSFLKKKNQEVGAAFIGELSGHFFFSADFYNHDDGVYSTLKLLNYLSRTGLKLSEAIAQLTLYKSSPEIKLYCADTEKVSVVARLATIVRQDWTAATVIDDERAGDGLRLDMDNGMFVIRYSQNGPYLTIKFEGRDEAVYDELKGYLNKLLHEVPEVDWENLINVNHNALN